MNERRALVWILAADLALVAVIVVGLVNLFGGM